MCGKATPQKILSGSLSGRRIFLRPPEPPPRFLLSHPSESIYLGKTKFLGVPFFWDPKKLLNPHVCIVGMSGSGKSYFVKTFITRAKLVLDTNALILDWTGEYCGWVMASGGNVLSFGTSGINLLDFSGPSSHERTRQVLDSLEMLTDISRFPVQKAITEDAIERAYFLAAKRRKSSKKQIPLPTLRDVNVLLTRMAEKTGSQDVLGAARRIRNLISSSGNSFCFASTKLENMVHGLTCVDLHTLPSESLRSLAGLAILQLVKERMRRESASGGTPSLFVVVDEAWKIASDDRSDVVSIVREGRKYGFGLIVASQNPSDVSKTIFSNAGTVVCFRQQSASDRAFVRKSLAYSDFFEQQSHSMPIGQALVHLAFIQPVSFPTTFILRKIDGEELPITYHLRGENMDLEFEKRDLTRRFLEFGLTDRQSSFLLAEFEKHNCSLPASDLALAFERFGQPRSSTISLLREMGADERALLELFSTLETGLDESPNQHKVLLVSGSKKMADREKKQRKAKR